MADGVCRWRSECNYRRSCCVMKQLDLRLIPGSVFVFASAAAPQRRFDFSSIAGTTEDVFA